MVILASNTHIVIIDSSSVKVAQKFKKLHIMSYKLESNSRW